MKNISNCALVAGVFSIACGAGSAAHDGGLDLDAAIDTSDSAARDTQRESVLGDQTTDVGSADRPILGQALTGATSVLGVSDDGAYAYLNTGRVSVLDVTTGVIRPASDLSSLLTIDARGVLLATQGYVHQLSPQGDTVFEGSFERLVAAELPLSYRDDSEIVVARRVVVQNLPRLESIEIVSNLGRTRSAPFELNELSTSHSRLSLDGALAASLDSVGSGLTTLRVAARQMGASVTSFVLPMTEARWLPVEALEGGGLAIDSAQNLWFLRFSDGAATSLSNASVRVSGGRDDPAAVAIVNSTVVFLEFATPEHFTIWTWTPGALTEPVLIGESDGEVVGDVRLRGSDLLIGVHDSRAVFRSYDFPGGSLVGTWWTISSGGVIGHPCSGTYSEARLPAFAFWGVDDVSGDVLACDGGSGVHFRLPGVLPSAACSNCWSLGVSVDGEAFYSQLRTYPQATSVALGPPRFEVYVLDSSVRKLIDTTRLDTLEIDPVRGGLLTSFHVGSQSYVDLVRLVE